MNGPAGGVPADRPFAQVRMACLGGQAVSALGFGCASLGSRIAPAAGIAALGRAHDAGVTWFDVAPSYGDGQAERLLGAFLRGRRGGVQVLTKVGIAPPEPSLKQRLVRPAMRLALAAAPELRAAIRRRRPAATKLPLEAALIPASLEASLRRLGTDHVDVLALHDATPDGAARDDVLRALEDAVAAGKARAVAIASSPEAAAAGLAAWGGYGLVQFANNPFARGIDRFAGLAGDARADRTTHSAFGADGAREALAALLARDEALRTAFAQAGYDGAAPAIAAAYFADYAFTQNAEGVIVMSMFEPRHLASNLARHARPRDAAAIARLASLIAAHAPE